MSNVVIDPERVSWSGYEEADPTALDTEVNYINELDLLNPAIVHLVTSGRPKNRL